MRDRPQEAMIGRISQPADANDSDLLLLAGVSVEAASPVLIERVRAVGSDSQRQYGSAWSTTHRRG